MQGATLQGRAVPVQVGQRQDGRPRIEQHVRVFLWDSTALKQVWRDLQAQGRGQNRRGR
jgi:hypothetical protein